VITYPLLVVDHSEIPSIKSNGKLEFLVTMRNGPGYADLSDKIQMSQMSSLTPAAKPSPLSTGDIITKMRLYF